MRHCVNERISHRRNPNRKMRAVKGPRQNLLKNFSTKFDRISDAGNRCGLINRGRNSTTLFISSHLRVTSAKGDGFRKEVRKTKWPPALQSFSTRFYKLPYKLGQLVEACRIISDKSSKKSYHRRFAAFGGTQHSASFSTGYVSSWPRAPPD